MMMGLRPVAMVAFIGFGISLIVHFATYWGVNLGQNSPSIWCLHFGIFPLFFLLILFGNGFKLDRSEFTSNIYKSIPSWAKITLTAFSLYAIINFAIFSFYLSEGGATDIRGGKYILHNHGNIIRELTEEEFNWHETYQLRGFSGHWMMFYLIPAMYFWFLEDMEWGS